MADRISQRQLVTELEHGNTEHLNGFFNGQFEEERVKALNNMRQMYLDDVKGGKAQPDTLEFQAHQWFGENIDISVNGKTAYSDKFDNATLRHSDPNDVAPANTRPFDMNEIRRVTSDLESGDPNSLKKALSCMHLEEQQRYIEQIKAQNVLDLTAKTTTAALGTYHGWTKDPKLEIGVDRYAGGFWNGLNNPQNVYTYSFDNQTGIATVSTHRDTR